MTIRTAETSPLARARVAGCLYLMTVPLGIFSLMYVPSSLIVSGDAAATANNIMASEALFRLGIVSTLLGQVIGILYILVLYRLLKPVSKNIAVLMVVFSLLGIPMTMLNELSQLGVLQLLSGADYLTAFTTEQLQALAYLLVRLHANGISIAAVFWGLWLFPLGYLVFKSGFLPAILGVLLIIAGFGYLIDSFALFLVPGSTVAIGLFTGWGEVIFPLWLVIKGVRVEQWKKRAAESA